MNIGPSSKWNKNIIYRRKEKTIDDGLGPRAETVREILEYECHDKIDLTIFVKKYKGEMNVTSCSMMDLSSYGLQYCQNVISVHFKKANKMLYFCPMCGLWAYFRTDAGTYVLFGEKKFVGEKGKAFEKFCEQVIIFFRKSGPAITIDNSTTSNGTITLNTNTINGINVFDSASAPSVGDFVYIDTG